MHEKKLQEITSVFFVKDYYFEDSLDLANKIRSEISDFDGPPLVLPVDNNAPPDIPRIILKNKNGSMQLQVSFERISLIVRGDSEDSLNISAKLMDMLSKVFIEKLQWTINRIGRIAIVRVKLDDSSLSFIKTKFNNNFFITRKII